MIKKLVKKFNLNKNEQGLTLTEVLIALAVLGVVSVPFLAGLSGSFGAITIADERTIAESLARTQLEVINNALYDTTSPYGYNKITDIPAGYDIAITVILIDPETGNASTLDLGVQKVSVTISHATKQVLQVESYKS
jgi:prepilin-type N-terminal cleavage/methylation domain-containing protein